VTSGPAFVMSRSKARMIFLKTQNDQRTVNAPVADGDWVSLVATGHEESRRCRTGRRHFTHRRV
jgi:hypothetical protein